MVFGQGFFFLKKKENTAEQNKNKKFISVLTFLLTMRATLCVYIAFQISERLLTDVIGIYLELYQKILMLKKEV